MKRWFLYLLMIALFCSSCSVKNLKEESATPDEKVSENVADSDQNDEEDDFEFQGPKSWDEGWDEVTENINPDDGLSHLDQQNKEKDEPRTFIKDENIKDEQREFYFDFTQKYRIDVMPSFKTGEQPALQEMKWYVALLCKDEVIFDATLNSSFVTGSTIERVAKDYFGVSYGLKPEDTLALEIGSYPGLPMAELIDYKEEQVGEKTLITARIAEYYFSEFDYVEDPEKYHPEDYQLAKNRIITGETEGLENSNVHIVQFYTEDGVTPTQFVSHTELSSGTEEYETYLEK